jgi:hypothetical protein
MKMLAAGLIVGSIGLVGCMESRTYLDPQQNGGGLGDSSIGSNVKLNNAFMKGDIGPVTGINAPGQIDGYDDPQLGSTTVNVTATSDKGSGLVILSLDKSLHNLPLGVTHMTGSNDLSSSSYVQLCSDTAGGDSVHFDGIAEAVDITVTPGEANARNFEINAKISQSFDGPSTPTTVNTHFTLLQ